MAEVQRARDAEDRFERARALYADALGRIGGTLNETRAALPNSEEELLHDAVRSRQRSLGARLASSASDPRFQLDVRQRGRPASPTPKRPESVAEGSAGAVRFRRYG